MFQLNILQKYDFGEYIIYIENEVVKKEKKTNDEHSRKTLYLSTERNELRIIIARNIERN